MWLANVGDSRAVLCEAGRALRLTQDHTPELAGETERVEKVGSSPLPHLLGWGQVPDDL